MINITRKVKAWIVGANRQIWNKGNAWPIAETIATASDQSGDDSLKSLGEQAVRLRHLLQTPRVVQRANPVSRQKHLLRSLRRYSSQGARLYVYRIETASKETEKLKEWKGR
jgi:hypothetical protein